MPIKAMAQDPMPFKERKVRARRRQKMEFRPCIDIHNGKVKQIVGSSLKDQAECAK